MRFRFERKYLVPTEQLASLRERMLPFLLPDHFASSNDKGVCEYTVRSIYYDTPAFDNLVHKVEGHKDRWKLRIRGYGKNPDNKVFMEVKKKIGDKITKSRFFTDFTGLPSKMRTGELFRNLEFEGDSIATPSSFHFHFVRDGYRPVSLVVYDREAYFGKFDSDVRITFDKYIRVRLFPSLEDLFDDTGLTAVWKGYFILEVKYGDKGMPTWVKSIIQEYQLRHEALSKYAEAFYTKDVSVYNMKTMQPRC